MNYSTKKYFLAFLILINFFSISLKAQIQDVFFDHISIYDGLSQSSALSILQDDKGFMWIGTHDGLNRYDGYNFQIFKYNSSDSNSIAGNIIYCLYETSDKELWIGTNGGGLNKFDFVTEKFYSFLNNPDDENSLSDNVVRSIFEDKNRNLWIGTDAGGLNLFNAENKSFKRYIYDKNDEFSISDNRINAIIQDKNGLLWIATNNGVNSFDIENQKFSVLNLNSDSKQDLTNSINDLIVDNQDNIWIATKNGLFKYNTINKKIEHYINKESDVNSLSNNSVTKLFIDNKNRLWVGTNEGLNVYNPENDNFQVYKHNALVSKSLNHDNISSIYQDKSGIIWIGAWERGLNFYDENSQKFSIIESSSQQNLGIPDKTVRSIFIDIDSSIWIGYVEGGLLHTDKNKRFSNIYTQTTFSENSLTSNTITSILRDSYGELWIGTWDGGLYRAKFSNQKEFGKWNKISGFEQFAFSEYDTTTLSENSVQFIFEDSKKRLWIGTNSGGLNLYNKSENNFIRISDFIKFNSNSFQSAIQEDSKGNIWVGTWNGLHKINNFIDFSDIDIELFVNDIENLNSLPENKIISLLIDKKGIIWVGTFGGGLSKMYFENGKYNYKNYTEYDGLANNVVYSIIEDDTDNIWLSTNKGISRFNPEKETFTNFDESDGLQDREFFWGARAKSRTGEIFFGGIHGVNSFFPDKITENNFVPPVVISDFKIFNKKVEIGENSVLKKSILLTDTIILSYKDKIISFEFTALHFSKPEKNQYEYILEGFNKEWIKVTANHRNVSFTNLDPGKYIFRVRGSNCDNVWNLQDDNILIIIKPPFWETWIFRIFVVILIIILIFIIFKWRLRRISRQKEKLEKEVNERTREITHKNSLLNHQKDEIQAQAEELKAINDELVKLSIVAAETDNAVIIIDDKGNIEWFNDGFIRLYGYEFDEFINLFGKNIFISNRNKDNVNMFDNLISTKQTIVYENKSLTKSGQEIWIQATLTPILDEFGAITKIVGIDTNITEIKKAEFQIIEKNRKIELQNKNIRESILYAQTIQQVILPSENKLKNYFDNFLIYLAKDIVSGDFYWFTKVVSEGIEIKFVAVVDCTGHGVPGAFMSMIGNRLLNDIVLVHKIFSPNEILFELNKGIIKALKQDESENNDGMDVCLCSIISENDNFKIIFSGAKRPLYFINSLKQEINEFEGDHRSCGGKVSLKSEIQYTNQEVVLPKNSMIYLTTDGFSDQNNPDRKRFRRRRMKEIFLENSEKTTNEQKGLLIHELSEFQQNVEQRDDITILGIKL